MGFMIVTENGADYNANIELEIEEILASCPHIISKREEDGYTFIDISIKSENEMTIKKEVLSATLHYFLYSVKREFIEGSSLVIKNKKMNFLLRRTMLFSNFEKEKNSLLEKVENYKKINLQGIKNFALNKIKIKWQDNIDYLNFFMVENDSLSDFKEYVKYASSMISSKHNLLYLFCGNKNFILSEKFKCIQSTRVEKENLSSSEEVISALIENYPKSLAIYQETYTPEIRDALEILFDVKEKNQT